MWLIINNYLKCTIDFFEPRHFIGISSTSQLHILYRSSTVR